MIVMTSKIKITTLCENSTPGFGLLPEYGLSMLLEIGKKRILFDTGSGYSLTFNASLLGIDLRSIKTVVLSHGHYDHTGGLEKLLGKSDSLSVYAHPEIFNKYLNGQGREPSYVGPSWTREQMQERGVRLHLSRGPVELERGVIITGQIPRVVEYENTEPNFLRKVGNGYARDLIYDDQALLVESAEGIVVLLGCAHAGLINTLRYVTDLTGERLIYAVLGGMHLMNASKTRLARTLEALKEYGIKKIAPCHCTGFTATVALYRAFAEKFVINQVGSVFEFG